MITKVWCVYRSRGIAGILAEVGYRLTAKRAKCFPLCKELLSEGVGLEIGGPSGVFRGLGILPIYRLVQSLDNCNFSNQTVWDGTIAKGMTFQYDARRQPGRQYMCEAADLKPIPDRSYDFIISSHAIEHMANPLRALSEWIRVLKDEGILVLVVPHKDATFDHRRPVTSLDHLLEDLHNGTNENDLTHLPEILELHDLGRDHLAGTPEEFKRRSEKNAENRCLHHHVFDAKLVVKILMQMNLQILAMECMWPLHIIAIARKVPPGRLSNNEAFADDRAEFLYQSPFASDRPKPKVV